MRFKLKYLYLFVFLHIFIYEKSQNLISNPSFEPHFDCSFGLIESSLPWCGVNPVGYDIVCQTDPTHSVPTQFFSPGYPSYQVPHSGNAYVNFAHIFPSMPATPARYPHTPLKDTLQAGKIYCVTYYISLWNDCKYSADKFGALFTAVPFDCTIGNQNLYTGYAPQVVSTSGVLYDDTLNWQEVSGTFTATGTEAYLTIGNFFPNAAHTYSISYPGGVRQLAEYYLDDVSVEVVEIVKAKNDTSIVLGDSIIVGMNSGEANLYNWQPTTGLSCTNCPNPKASPSVTTTYTVTKTQCKVTTTDVITVSVSPTGIREMSYWNRFVGISPNPTNGLLSIRISTPLDETNGITIKITDVLGKVTLVMDYKEQIDISPFENGIYFLSLYKGNQLLVTKKVVKQ